LASIIDIARMAGVSKTTVSKVFNNQYGVSAETRQKVLEAARELHYTPNQAARSLVTSRTNVIGVVYDALVSPIYTELAGHLEKACSGYGYHLVFCNCNDNHETKVRYMNYFAGGSADGVILFGSDHRDRDIIETLLQNEYPFSVIENRFDDLNVNHILINNFDGARKAVHYLAGLNHNRIAHVTGNMQHRVASDRLNGYITALQDLNMLVRPEHILYTDAAIGCGAAAARAFMELEDRPTAILAFNDIIAYEMIGYFQQQGLQVPEHISIVGFDHIKSQLSFLPVSMTLTSMAQPMDLVAQAAVEATLSLITSKGAAPVQTRIFDTRLVEGNSCWPVL
jgi:DNA-binding LacI/PurR family transcriptional regulator